MVIRSLIVNFEFDLAFEGQIPKPTAAVTMSKFCSLMLQSVLIDFGSRAER